MRKLLLSIPAVYMIFVLIGYHTNKKNAETDKRL